MLIEQIELLNRLAVQVGRIVEHVDELTERVNGIGVVLDHLEARVNDLERQEVMPIGTRM